MGVQIMSIKKRTEEEILSIIEDFMNELSLIEISKKYDIGEDAIYRILQKFYGVNQWDETKKKRVSRVKKLEKSIKEKDREIALLKAALKKL